MLPCNDIKELDLKFRSSISESLLDQGHVKSLLSVKVMASLKGASFHKWPFGLQGAKPHVCFSRV